MREKRVVVAVLGTEIVKVGEGSVRESRAEREAQRLAPLYAPAVVTTMPESRYAPYARPATGVAAHV